jgi:hypothetical protein
MSEVKRLNSAGMFAGIENWASSAVFTAAGSLCCLEFGEGLGLAPDPILLRY